MNSEKFLLIRLNILLEQHNEAIKWINRTMHSVLTQSRDATKNDWEYVLHYKEDIRRQYEKIFRLIGDIEEQINQKLND